VNKTTPPGRRPITRLLLIDSCRTYSEGLRHSLEQVRWLHVIATAGSADEVHDLTNLGDADVALLDIDLSGQSGMETCRWLLAQQPTLAVLMLSFWDWDVYPAAAHDAHASGFVLRSAPTAELIQAIEQARYGRIFTSEQTARVTAWRIAVGEQLATLAPREWDVLWLLAAGITHRAIARQLKLRENTTEKHVSSILHKLGLESRFALLAFIHRHHLDVLAKRDPTENC
jgi:DNA-binding NarL/FixJ family response regulator